MRPVRATTTLLGVDVSRAAWLREVELAVGTGAKGRLRPGSPTDAPARVPLRTAERMLRGVVRFVADLPAGSSPQVVWRSGEAELLVHTDRITLALAPGTVRIGLTVDCDQLDAPTEVVVPLGVGTLQAPAGLVMSGLTRVEGPAVVADLWSEALTAFAWESLLELARRLCAGLGKDSAGRVLVPGSIGATTRELLVHPMARTSR
jgi:hypothetical protein